LGYPTDLPILVSFDTEVRAGGQVRPEVIAYGREFAAACHPYPIGIYGGTPIMHELADLNRLGWRAMASSWSSGSWPDAVVHWRQRRPNLVEQQRTPYVGTPAGWSLDVNDAVLPFPAWSNTIEAPDIIPQRQEDDGMDVDYNGMILNVAAHAIRRVVSGEFVASPKPVSRTGLVAELQTLRVAGGSPFDGSVPGYADADLDALWKSRPSAWPAVQTVPVTSGSGTFNVSFG
jgi:hypothetical protein